MKRSRRTARLKSVLAGAVLACLFCAPSWAAIMVEFDGPGGRIVETLPDEGGAFAVGMPLAKNAVNPVTVTATDGEGNAAQREVSITQVSLADVVVSEFTSEPLPPERVEQLVREGVIDLEDPANFNVSEFAIVLTINHRPIEVRVPIAVAKNEAEPQGWETYRMPVGDDSTAGRRDPQPIEIVVFEKTLPTPPGEPSAPKVPGVFIIEGRIKSLKEFFSCRLLLMNTSGIFTLSDVVAELTFPDGGLSKVLPADGIASFGDIVPGDGGQPGQVEKEFIIRGDEIGVRGVRVDFGGLLTGPGISENAPIPFNGAAETTVEVLGPPSFQVEVFHPESVVAGVPYDLKVDITNTGDAPALYASLEIDVAAAGKLTECTYDPGTGAPACEEVEGPAVRALGHIFPGETTSQVFTIIPAQTGVVSACTAAADQNISLNVYVGPLGCAVGQFPPDMADTGGAPAVSVVPAPNALNVSPLSPIVAFFSERILESSITTGENGSFNVFDPAGNLLPGELRFDELGMGTDTPRTVAIWQYRSQTSTELPYDTELTVVLTQDIVDYDIEPLANPWQSTFETTALGAADQDPPDLTLAIRPPVIPGFVLPGQIVEVSAYASDQGSGVRRVEARFRNADDPAASYELIDVRSLAQGDEPPFFFALDSSPFELRAAYQVKATAYDFAGNVREQTIGFVMANSAAPPTVTLPEDPALPVLQGISVNLTPTGYTGGVRRMQFYLDSSLEPFHTATLPPFTAALRTLALGLGDHTVRAVALDGLEQTGEDTLTIELIENVNMPVVDFRMPDGVSHVQGSLFTVNPLVEDPVGIAGIEVFLDGVKQDPTAVSGPVVIDTAGLDLGNYTLTLVATNLLGVSNDPDDPASVLTFSIVEPPPGVPPEAPLITLLSPPEQGAVHIEGTTAPLAQVEVTNMSLGLSVPVNADASGAFSADIEANVGDVIEVRAYDLSQSADPSDPATASVPAPPVLEQISVVPAAHTFTDFDSSLQLEVKAHWDDGNVQDVTADCSYSSSAKAVVSVNALGRMAPQANGPAVVTAAYRGKTAAVDVTVDVVVLTHISVLPAALAFTALDQTQALEVTRHFSDGSEEQTNAGVAFASGDPAVAKVDAVGVVTAMGNGSTNITAYLSGAEPASIPVSVNTATGNPPEVAILSPADGTEVERGDLVEVTVRGTEPIGGVTKLSIAASGATTADDSVQTAPAETEFTSTLRFTVADDAPIGGTILVTALAEGPNGVSPIPAVVTLTVADETPPAVMIVDPANDAAFGYGEVVTVRVHAADAVGVAQVRYETQGAVVESGSQTLDPAANPAEAAFTFTIPFAVQEPDIRIRAYATDATGLEGASAPVDIIVRDADQTPPSTIATAVSAPAGTSVTVSYEVTDGLADLDYVVLFFRRNGIGTFNRYTRADAGNPRGRFTPQSGAQGTIAFDSTRMGGDGTYEFYTVGVDAAGNRELPPDDGAKAVVPDQTTAITAGTVWTTLATDTEIGPADSTYDGQNVRIDGAAVTMSGTHSFQNMELLNGAVLTHPETTLDTEYALEFTCWSLSIDTASRIDVNARGYLGGLREGNGDRGRTLGNAEGSTRYSGGSYGGVGGSVSGGVPNDLYGNLTAPAELGSGGAAGSNSRAGGDGGGRIQVNGINIACEGAIQANGVNGSGYSAGSGSGGGIYLAVSTLSGSGTVAADGAAYEVGGGGGRIAVHYVDISTLDTELVHALGGAGSSSRGGNGTVFLKSLDEANGTLVVDGQGVASGFSRLPIPPGYTFDRIILRNEARVVADNPLVVADSLEILTGSILTHTLSSEAGLTIEADRIYVDATSRIDATGKGYRGGLRDGNAEIYGLTLGELPGARRYSGGSYGGMGGETSGGVPNPAYGHPAGPVYLGSGGAAGSNSRIGGNGGGRITITAHARLEVDGVIAADGTDGNGFSAGSGSGGSVLIETSVLAGDGWITANGGRYEVGGGGGRIAIAYDYLGPEALGETQQITAFGHNDNHQSSAGTVVLRKRTQTHGDLYVDAGRTDSRAPVETPLTHLGFGAIAALTADTLTTDGSVAMIPGGLVGLEVNPNIEQDQTFTILANTETEITIDTGKALLTDVAAVGGTYAAVYTFDNLYLRRGGHFVLGDRVIVAGTTEVADYCALTHYDARLDFESRIDLWTGHLRVDALGTIDTDGRGYLGGGREGNSAEGRTFGNVPGATYISGASHGGLGAAHTGVPNAVYGSLTRPEALGAGGSMGSNSRTGGDGGGRIALHADTISLEGAISANGLPGGGFSAGSGAGGSALIFAQSVEGSGIVQTNGGGYETGGGGGRIAVIADSLAETVQLHASGHASSRHAGNGTIYIQKAGQALGDLVVDGLDLATPSASTVLPGGYTFDNILLRNRARAVADEPIMATQEIRLEADSVLTHSPMHKPGLHIEAARIIVDETSRIDTSGQGYPGGGTAMNTETYGLTLGGLPGSTSYSGGSYGGLGAQVSLGIANQVYGHPGAPVYLGSGGSRGGNSRAGGNGGGRIHVLASNYLQVDGAIQANGLQGDGYSAGSGSGGSVYVETGELRGTGVIAANGGASEVGGGGGRVAIIYDTLGAPDNDLDALRGITAFGGHASTPGSAGTVLLRHLSQPLGDLYIDGGYEGSTAPAYTPLTPITFGAAAAVSGNSLTTDGKVRLIPNGLVGLELNPNTDQEQTFTIVANSEDGITVTPGNGTNLEDVSAAGDTYVGIYRFDNVYFRRGGFLCIGDRLLVNEALVLDEYGVLSHFDATLDYESHLEAAVGLLDIRPTGGIDVSGRGYLGGLRSGNGSNGRTLGNAEGSTPRSGGSYGGLGGAVASGVPNATYGDADEPAALGSGGSAGSNSRTGGDGGGWVNVTAETAIVDGRIAADGLRGNGFSAGGGSGGTVRLRVNALSGSGVIRADGGGNEVGGGGGRIALDYDPSHSDMANLDTHANGGTGGGAPGQDGTW